MGKLDRAVGAFCIALSGFAALGAVVNLRAAGSEHAWAEGLASMPGTIALALALVAAIPGFFLLFRKGTI